MFYLKTTTTCGFVDGGLRSTSVSSLRMNWCTVL